MSPLPAAAGRPRSRRCAASRSRSTVARPWRWSARAARARASPRSRCSSCCPIRSLCTRRGAASALPVTELVGADPEALRRVRGDRIAIVFQEPMTSLNPLHTLERQVAETLLIHRRMSSRAARVRTLDLLRLVGLPDAENRLDAYPHQLSGGQRQRVMIAMAIANEPDMLIADEPTTALDVTIQAHILQLLRDLRDRFGMALLLITHDLTIVRRMAERVAVMTMRRDRRDRPDRGDLRPAAPPLYPAAAGGGAQGPGGARRPGSTAADRSAGAARVVCAAPRRAAPGQGPPQGGRRRLARSSAPGRPSASSARAARAKRRSGSPCCA